MYKGIGCSFGIGLGPAFRYVKQELIVPETPAEDIAAEKERFDEALAYVQEQTDKLAEKARAEMGDEEAAIFEAHGMIIQDPEMQDSVRAAIDGGMNAAHAVKTVFDGLIDMFHMMDDEYFRERAADMADIGQNILRRLLGISLADISNLPGPCVIVAHDLTPSDTAKMDMKNVRGFVTQVGGRTSHTAIMARALDIPAVVGCEGVLDAVKDGDTMAVYGEKGEVEFPLDEAGIARVIAEIEKINSEKEQFLKYKNMPSITVDGHQVEISANIGTPGEAAKALEVGADGVGLFRSEFLYMDRDSLPTEEEQFEAYKQAVVTLGKPIIVRTLDIGGDKKLPALPLPQEENPFLGYRAIRICLDDTALFNTQLRALLRASAYGDIRIMFPMISSLAELNAAKAAVEAAKAELRAENVAFHEEIKLGIMIEIPAAAVMSDVLAKHCDFFSIGTNDLIQYTVAVDRGNEKIAHLYSQYNPAVLRLIHMTIKNAHDNGIHCGMCGEAAGDELLTPVLLGMGLDEFSMSASSVLRVRKLMAELNYAECAANVEKVLNMGTAAEVVEYLKG